MPLARKNQIEFANFHLTFGDHGLMDWADEIVFPALLAAPSQPTRTYGNTSWVIHEPSLVELPGGRHGLVFQFIKNMKLQREQIYRPGIGPERSLKSMPSSPSAYVLIILENHRLIYLPKTKFPPSLVELKNTCLAIIKAERDRYVLKKIAEEVERVPKEEAAAARAAAQASWAKKLPQPNLEILHLPASDKMAAAIDRYEKLTKVAISLIRTNGEFEQKGFWKQFEEEKVKMGAKTARVEHLNPAGLSKEQAKVEVNEAAAELGDAEIALSGKIGPNQRLDIKNEHIRAKRTANFRITTPKNNAADMVHALDDLISENIVKPLPKIAAAVIEKVATTFEKWKKTKKQ